MIQKSITKTKRLTVEDKTKLNNQYQDLKRQIDTERDKYTLVEYEILDKAFKIGKRLRRSFSMAQLSKDFGVPYAKVKRLLSLNRMSEKTKRLVKEKKIPLFMVAQITTSKNNFFQEEIIDEAIKNNYTTHDLKGLKVKSMDDVKNMEDLRMKKIKREGYARRYVAYIGFNRALNNMNMFLDMDMLEFTEPRHVELNKRLLDLKDKLDKRFR